MYLLAKEIPQTNLLTEWKGREGKFVRTFGMNTRRNKNEWRTTWQAIKDNIHTALDMPGIEFEVCKADGCDLDHVEAETKEENIEKQKPYARTNIIDYVLDEDKKSVDLIHEVHDDSFWEKLEKRLIKFVSPLIWPRSHGVTVLGKGRAGLPIIDTTAWDFVHHAFLNKNPAYGDDTATVKTMCEGKNCDVQLLTAKYTALAGKAFGAKSEEERMIEIGTEIEMEHTTCPDEAKKIALDHIREDPDYYTKLLTYVEPENKHLLAKSAMCGNCKFFVEDGRCEIVSGGIDHLDLCDLHVFGEVQPKGTDVNPMVEKTRVNYRPSGSLEAETTTANQDNLQHLQEVPLLYKHKGSLTLLSASKCVQDIIKKKKSEGVEIDDQALAIAYSECGQSQKAKSSFKTCSCFAKQVKMSSEESYKKENDELKAKLKAMEDKEDKEKSYQARKARYAKLFASVEEEEREKMVAAMTDEDEDELKAACEVNDEMKSKKGSEDDPEKEELKARVTALEAKEKEIMIKDLVALRGKQTTESPKQINEYHAGLKGKSFADIESRFKESEPLIQSMKASVSVQGYDNNTNQQFWTPMESTGLAGKTFDELEEGIING